MRAIKGEITLVAQRISGARGHDYRGALVGENTLDEAFLQRPEFSVAPITAQGS
jgi:hypothetical protein